MNKKYFPGANTGIGFVNSFSGINPPWAAPCYTYVLKGGPGVGKNTLMKKAVEAAEKAGYEAEEFRCASDPQSFDAVRIPDMGVILLDGTAPHIIDPVIPGAADEIVNLGHFINQKKFTGKRYLLKSLFDENSRHYRTAFAYLKAARDIKLSSIAAVREVMNLDLVHRDISEIFSQNEPGESKRRLFSRSITPEGVIDFSDTLFGGTKQINISGPCGAVIMEAAKSFGGRLEFFMDPVTGDIPMHIRLEDMVLSNSEAVSDSFSIEYFLTKPIPDFIEFNDEQIRLLTEKACDEISMCRQIHDEIEAIYRPFVDYEKVNRETEELFAKIGL